MDTHFIPSFPASDGILRPGEHIHARHIALHVIDTHVGPSLSHDVASNIFLALDAGNTRFDAATDRLEAAWQVAVDSGRGMWERFSGGGDGGGGGGGGEQRAFQRM
jgi:hypothetical protein